MEKKRVLEDEATEESEPADGDSPEVKRLREDLLNGLDDDDDDDDESNFCNASQDLDSFMRSFEVEIAPAVAEADSVDPASDCGDSRPDLGYLLEASDDELGIPPPPAPANAVNNELTITASLGRVGSESSEFGGEFWEIPNYDTLGSGFEFGFGETDKLNCEYLTLDGLFERSDSGTGSVEFSQRPGTLPAQ